MVSTCASRFGIGKTDETISTYNSNIALQKYFR